jgi:predicted phage tail protein
VLVSIAALFSSGCLGSSTSTPAARSGTVSGLVVIEGGSQVASNGGVAELRTVKAAPLVITSRTTAGRRLVRHSRTDARGRFRLRLPAGRYTVTARVFPVAPVQPHRIVVVIAGKAVAVTIKGTVI